MRSYPSIFRLSLLIASILSILAYRAVLSQELVFPIGSALRTIEETLKKPDEEIDLVWLKLTVDKMVDPSVDIQATQEHLDKMARDLRAMLLSSSSDEDKLKALKAYLYEPGKWNDFNSFQYNLSNPLGTNVKDKLLTNYLRTRKGNCVSMPILFLFLGEKIGLNITLARAPNHLFIKYRDSSGAYYNIETTSGGNFARDVWMHQKMPMTDRAVASGIYMRPLTKKEMATDILLLLNEAYSDIRFIEKRRQIARLSLKHDPKNIAAILHMMTSYQQELNYEFGNKYPNIPAKEKERYSELYNAFGYWYQKAEDLGWKPSDLGN
ncbi:MAG: transglutaminase-like domain-containing protein [Proteobacteria bacterium]|nr:transglutaminase-like domain-containing protein [Pseudomonadota bacterium]